MQLLLNATSPYARVARIVALEKGLGASLALRTSDPWTDDPELLGANPINRVPVLITDTGETIAESLLIAVYLNAQVATPQLLPAERLAATLQLAGVAQGLLDATFNTVIARKHGGRETDTTLFGQRRLVAIERALVALETAAVKTPYLEIDLGYIVVGVALAYLAFRMPEIDWQSRYAGLHAFYRQISQRESFSSTAFV